jgi:hypothetical protein
MPSSISSSEIPATRNTAAHQRWVVVLLAFIAVFVVSIECMARWAFTRISRIEQRVQSQSQAARSIGQNANGSHPRTVLLVGNSLLGAGVETSVLRQAMPPGWKLAPLQVDDTTYMDWYFGLRRLFAEGARPEVVAVMLSPTQAIATSVRGEFFARHLMQTSDIISVTRELSLHRTNASSMLFARMSEFYGVRAEIRNWLLLKIMPGFQSVASLLTRHPRRPVDDRDVRNAAGRLQEMRELAEHYHVKLIWVLPSLLQTPDGTIGFLDAAKAAQVPVLTPAPSGSLAASNYTDGFHLAPAGAHIYTGKLIPLLQQYLCNL